MPGTTATQGLIYPVDGDRACDGALQFEVLAKGMAARYAVLDAAIDLAEAPPALLVEWYSPDRSFQPLETGRIAWNTVGVDDAGAYDAALSVDTVTLPYVAPGQLWEIGMHAEGRWESFSDTEVEWQWELRITSQASIALYSVESTLTANTTVNSVSGGGSQVIFHETTGNDIISVDWSTFNNDPTLVYAQLWAFRIGEA